MNNVESAQDRRNEIDVLEFVCKKYPKLSYKQTRLLCRYDADLYKEGELYAIAEIKCRKFASTKYPDFMFKVDKWMANKGIAEKLGVKFIVLFRYTDGIFYIDETNRTLKGRKQTDIVMKNSHNGEPERVFFTPLSELTRL